MRGPASLAMLYLFILPGWRMASLKHMRAECWKLVQNYSYMDQVCVNYASCISRQSMSNRDKVLLLRQHDHGQLASCCIMLDARRCGRFHVC
jgi:hypothetical protein